MPEALFSSAGILLTINISMRKVTNLLALFSRRVIIFLIRSWLISTCRLSRDPRWTAGFTDTLIFSFTRVM